VRSGACAPLVSGPGQAGGADPLAVVAAVGTDAGRWPPVSVGRRRCGLPVLLAGAARWRAVLALALALAQLACAPQPGGPGRPWPPPPAVAGEAAAPWSCC